MKLGGVKITLIIVATDGEIPLKKGKKSVHLIKIRKKKIFVPYQNLATQQKSGV